MHPKLVRTLLALAALAGSAATLPASAQSISINNGTACTYTSFSVSAGANGLPSYNFTAAGCNLGSGTPTSGTMQFSSATYGSISTGATAVVSITNTGRITGGTNTLNGSVTSATTGICTVPVPSDVTFSDADTSAKNVTVTAISPGTCTLNLSGVGTGSPSQATITITNPAQPGVLAFTAASQSATPGGPSVTFTVAQTGAGSSSPAAGVSYACVSVANTGSWTPVFTPASTGTLSWATGENGNKTFSATVPALPVGATSGTITCQLSSPTGAGVTLGSQTTHTVNVATVAAPVCTISASPNSITSGTASTVSFSSNCTNSPTSYAWTAVTGGAPAITGSGSTASASFGTTVAAGSYTYQLIATNAGGSSTAATTSVTVTAPTGSNCVVKPREQFPGPWIAGNAYNATNSPLISQPAAETWAFRMTLDDLLDQTQAPYGAGAFQLYEAAINVYHTISISVNPCEFTDAPTGAVCQMSNSTGSFGPRYARWNHPASDTTLIGANYCRLPNPGAQQFLYVNVRFAGPPVATVGNPNPITAPAASTCTTGVCGYYPLYTRF